MGHILRAHSRLGIRTPRQDESLKHNHHIRLDAPDTPMDYHRRRLQAENRPKSDSDVNYQNMKGVAIGADFFEGSFAKSQ
jgi:hypothetical protein